MATPTFITGFETGVISEQGGGIASSIVGIPLIESSVVRTGNYSLKIAPTAIGALNIRRNTSGAGVKIGVARVYIRIPTGGMPSQTAVGMFSWLINNASTTAGIAITSAGVIQARLGSGTSIDGPTISLDTWYRIDIRLDITGTTWMLDWQVDGVDQTQATWGSQLTTDSLNYLRLGTTAGGLTMIAYYDDLVISETSADYPIGPGGTELLVPSGSATSNAGTNIIEEANGTDAGASSYLALNSVPMGNATNYIRQFANGTGNYLGVSLANISATHTGIIGASAILAYTSATTTSNRGACIVSKDAFSSFTTIWGNPTTTSDYSDGNTSSPYFKSAMVAGVVDDSTVNALEVRMGYSDDANPNPYWLDVAVEVAYSTGAGSTDIDLDLVSFSSTINDITILENEVINLDLVSYSSTVNDLTVTENILIDLDLVTYLIDVNDISILENEVINLDLVSYSITINDIEVLENEIISLDLVSYSVTVNDLSILEHDIIDLDLVSFSSTINDITMTENVDIDLDLVSYSSIVNDITVIENEIIPLDLVSYTSEVYELDVLEEGEIPLDLVTYTSTVNDLTVLENEIIHLDLVTFTTTINDADLLENEIIHLDLVGYSSLINDLELLGDDVILLDLVVFSSVVFDVLLIGQSEIVRTPGERCYAISRELRNLEIEIEERIIEIDFERRINV